MVGTAAAAMVATLCLSAGAAPPVTVAAPHFILRWQHSIEKIIWEEDYVVAGNWLLLSGVRIRGSGAGMEPPPGAQLQGGVWHYRIANPWRRTLELARSEFARDYELCLDGMPCQLLERWIPVSAGTTTLRACTAPE